MKQLLDVIGYGQINFLVLQAMSTSADGAKYIDLVCELAKVYF